MDGSWAPLKGVKVIEVCQRVAGPAATQMLAWFGADVIKVEPPDGGDITRRVLRDIPHEDSLFALVLNSSKKSIALDLKVPDGREILRKMVQEADVLVENLAPGTMESWRLGWDDLHPLNPRLIMGTLSTFAPGTSYPQTVGYDALAQCTGGNASVTGWWTGPYDRPLLSGVSLGECNSASHLVIAVLGALLSRSRTGEGCHVSQSMQRAVMNLCRTRMHDQLLLDATGVLPEYPEYPDYPQVPFGRAVPREGNAEGGGELGWCYKCKGWESDPNAWVYVVVQRSAKGFEELARAIGHPEVLTDPAYKTPKLRFAHQRELRKLIEAYTITRTKDEVTAELGAAGVPVGPVLSWHELENDQELFDNGILATIDQGGHRGTFKTIGLPEKISGFTPVYGPVPSLGQHTDEVLKGLGLDEDTIEHLRDIGVVA